MPTYNFYDPVLDVLVTDFMPISEMEEFLKENPQYQLLPAAPAIHSGRGLRTKPESGFRDVLKEIKKNNSRGLTDSTVNTF